MGGATRRGAIAGGLALAACDRPGADPRAAGLDPADPFPTAAGRAPAAAQAPVAAGPSRRLAGGPLPRLRDLAPFPLGDEVSTGDLADPVVRALAATQFSQLTIGWEAKMEKVLRPDGSLDFAAADQVADFVRANGQALMGAAVIWHIFRPEPFVRLAGDATAFGAAYDRYIAGLLGHYRGRIRGWDVVNESINDDGTDYFPCLWGEVLGYPGYIARAFHAARAADPHAVLFLNEGGQEIRPRKLDFMMRLVDRLLAMGAPVTGLGAQLHVGVDIAPGDIARTLKTMAAAGLPIHVSEFDVTRQSDRRLDLRSPAEKTQAQQRIYAEALDAFHGLPARQQFAFTVFGVRDRDSWLRIPPNAGDGHDAPLLFDDAGQPKPLFWTVADTLRRMRA